MHTLGTWKRRRTKQGKTGIPSLDENTERKHSNLVDIKLNLLEMEGSGKVLFSELKFTCVSEIRRPVNWNRYTGMLTLLVPRV